MSSEFGELLRQLRRQADLTQEDLGRRSGVSVSTIRGLETGKRSNPRMATVQELSDALRLLPGDRKKLLETVVVQSPRDAGEDRDAAAGEPADGGRQGTLGGGTAGLTRTDAPRGAPTPAGVAADAAEQLARLMAARWQREEEQRHIHDPFPLPVRWQPGPEAQTDHWANILCLPPGGDADPLDLTGRLDGIARTYRRIPSGRLVILGRAGSGKTILTLRLVLDLLKTRTDTEPIPVIFSIGTWNPTTHTLRDWLAKRLTRDHPGYAAQGPTGRSLAAELVDSGRVLPVLDGFDELAEGLRRPALKALNATALPLVLTSRPDEYTAAVALADVLTSAATIELTDLTLDDLVGYLPRTTRKTDAADPTANVWDPVLAELRERPHDPHVARVASVLTTPLMVALARTVYSDSPDHEPAELLRNESFGSSQALEEHLLGCYVSTVYHPEPGRVPVGDRARTSDPDRVGNWLGYLARHLTVLGTPDLAWWRIGSGLRRSSQSLVTALMVGIAVGFVDFGVGTLVGPVRVALIDAPIVGLLAGLLFGFAHWITFGVRNVAATPSAVRLRVSGRTGTFTRSSGHRLLLGALCGTAFGSCYGMALGVIRVLYWHIGIAQGLRIGISDGIIFALVFGGSTGLTYCLLGVLEAPLDLGSAVDPRSLLVADRRTALTQMVVWAPFFGLVVGIGSYVVVALLQRPLGPLAWSPASSVIAGALSGFGGAVGYGLTLTAWGQWVLIARIWLPLTGRLPWALMSFLDDAYQRGVLRQAGAVYQFRHARMQEHLARAHRARTSELGGPADVSSLT
ncbi:helix-turn-helix domain-containing protein [Streptomyces odontomachi]|uniref:helix-turn-helix domain-containing protein n=1 Tax=Streptomyces odontomachi TaxID=2944940 RepID=UPI00210E4F3A|nr:helix-turn-helix transcriptional regulator [Streptomyces sp. ODS25]